jgi:hypothetical protein
MKKHRPNLKRFLNRVMRQSQARIFLIFLNLTQLRDWLLPMLMNGQVTVGTNER